MLEDSPSLELPPRSRLFSLNMAGSDDFGQEAILDFAQRLSAVHRVRVRDMFAQVILPEANVKGAFYIPGHFAQHAIRGCNGWSAYGQAFVAAMQRLTGRADMAYGSLANWAGLLSDRGYVATQRRWCSECLRLQEDSGFHWFSLIWAFEAVRICPIHMVTLSEVCGRCGRGQPWIGDAVALGLCVHCHAPLKGAYPGTPEPLDRERTLTYANAVADMISAARLPPEILTIQNYQLRLQEAADRAAGGSLMRLENQLNLNAFTMGGHQRHTMAFFLELMFRLGTTPMAFLTGELKGAPRPDRSKVRFVLRHVLSAVDIEAAHKRVDERLRLALADDSKITTRIQFARDVGISNSCLGTHFSEAKLALREHNDKIRPLIRQRQWDLRARAIQKAMCRLMERSLPLTASSVSKALIEIGLHRRHPTVRRLAAAAIDRARGQVLNQDHGGQTTKSKRTPRARSPP